MVGRIERFFNRAKNSRRVATRYDKLIESFAAFVLLACIQIWIKFVHTQLGKLKSQNEHYDIDSAFYADDRQKEMEAALAAGASVVWCLSDPKRMNFFGYRETHLGYAAPKVAAVVKRSGPWRRRGGEWVLSIPTARSHAISMYPGLVGPSVSQTQPMGSRRSRQRRRAIPLKNGCSKTPIQGLRNSWMCGPNATYMRVPADCDHRFQLIATGRSD
jgi:hypothetical protein